MIGKEDKLNENVLSVRVKKKKKKKEVCLCTVGGILSESKSKWANPKLSL